MLSTVKKGLIAVGVLTVTSANASVDVSKVTLDVGSLEAIAGVMLGALALIWVARRLVSFLGNGNSSIDLDTSYDLWQQDLISYEEYMADWKATGWKL